MKKKNSQNYLKIYLTDFETSSGYSMKICDSKFVELKNLEKYLLSKWNNVFPKKTRSRSRSRSLSLNNKK